MQKASPSIRKIEWRKRLESARKAIPEARRNEASEAIFELLKNRGRLLSFSTIGSEIDLSRLNLYLAQRGALWLPRLEQGEIVPYSVSELKTGLVLSQYNIPEPDPSQNRRGFHFDAILVPALAFDRDRYRIGYGKGCYDRFLSINGRTRAIGIGFREQLSEESLPRDPWDMRLDELILV
jgi:5-formyltetrahydrofolate cyclo-ligase